ncbi:unnamed protein product [Leptosia nina]|uniref:C2H2-type domain-containing protein n=1 Tax=Leptosia nina TaxID=320188 RepID=A0AAV1JQ39_9NEOP
MSIKVPTLGFVNCCKCCLDDENLLYMWEESYSDGQIEIYGDMLLECFSLPWLKKNDSDLICSSCVDKLRNSLNFKREIVASEEILKEGLVLQTDITSEEKIEAVDDNSAESCNVIVPDEDALVTEKAAEVTNNELLVEMPVETSKRKWPKKRKGADRLKVYKKYTQWDLRKAIKDIEENQLSLSYASEKYNIPRSTMKTYIKKLNEDPDALLNDFNEESSKGKQFRFIEEIKTLLQFSNIMPFKSKTAKYYCAYCSTDGPVFQDADELRLHTKTHEAERLSNVDHFMRPYWLNEILKVDVMNLSCVVCNIKLEDWNAMFQHFDRVHEIEFNDAYTKIIPYNLNHPIHCVLCSEHFTNFHQLDGHMNRHYDNYICPECGDSFVANSRLDRHIQLHKRGQFPCELCGKVFPVEKYRVKHYNLVHKSTFKCRLCKEAFTSDLLRHLHMVQSHNSHVKTLTCEFCGQVFTYKPYFLRHVERMHNLKKRQKCTVCLKTFRYSHELKNHFKLHLQDGKHNCPECGLGFNTFLALKRHAQRH